METIKEKLQLRRLCRIYINLNMFFNFRWIWSKKTLASSFRKENNFKTCLTKQHLNMFKHWCERGIKLPIVSWNAGKVFFNIILKYHEKCKFLIVQAFLRLLTLI